MTTWPTCATTPRWTGRPTTWPIGASAPQVDHRTAGRRAVSRGCHGRAT
jgi:hypothetical protein